MSSPFSFTSSHEVIFVYLRKQPDTCTPRRYDEGGVGSGRNYVVVSGELNFPLVAPMEGAIFVDYGSDLDSGSSVLGNPAGARHKRTQVGSPLNLDSGSRIRTHEMG